MRADIDRNGTIDCAEFVAATLHMNKLEREENLASPFSFFDKDGNGYITTDELSQACHEFGVDVAHLEDMIKDVEQNNVSRFIFSILFTFLFQLHSIDSWCTVVLSVKFLYIYDFLFRNGESTMLSLWQ